MSIDARLDKLAPALTAKERAILILRAWKEGVPEDPLIRSKMPAEQGLEFNHYIGLMRGVHDLLSLYTLILDQSLSLLSARYGWLLSLHLWALTTTDLAGYIAFHTKEPITRSEFGRLLKAARGEMMPAIQPAQILAERYPGWADEDLEPQEGDDEPLVKPAAWKRMCREKEQEIARLVEQGVLVGTRKRWRLYVNAGSFYDWLGEPTPVFPDWGFEILPDRKAGEVRRLRQAREAAREALTHVPLSLGEDLVGRKLGHSPEDSTRTNRVAEAVGTTLREGIQMRWRELLEVELVLDEIAPEFDGEHPARSRERQALTQGRTELKELHEQVQEYVGPFDLPGSDEEETEQMREAIRRAAKR